MINATRVSFILLFLTLAYVSSLWLTPSTYSGTSRSIDLEALIPHEFLNWKEVTDLPVVLGDPQTEEYLDVLYSQTMSRTYEDVGTGARVMLSVSYGVTQRDNLVVHFPDVCYPAQGFEIIDERFTEIQVQNVNVPIKFLVTRKGARHEDVTFWVKVGDDIVTTRLDQKISTIKYAMQGVVADGLLFRVSTIGVANSLQVHQKFIEDMFSGLSDQTKAFLLAGQKVLDKK